MKDIKEGNKKIIIQVTSAMKPKVKKILFKKYNISPLAKISYNAVHFDLNVMYFSKIQ